MKNTINRIVVGYVVQTFNEDGTFVSQNFIGSDYVEYENQFGEVLDEGEIPETVISAYPPIEMVQ